MLAEVSIDAGAPPPADVGALPPARFAARAPLLQVVLEYGDIADENRSYNDGGIVILCASCRIFVNHPP